MKEKTKDIIARGNTVIMPTYARFPIVFDHGNGCVLTDTEGKNYLDFVGGIAVNCLGYNDPGLNKTISDQCKKMMHVSNLYWNEPMINTAELLTKLSGLDKVFMCNSGAEANEAAMKLARIYAKLNKSKEAVEIIAMDHSFHGRTYAAITATGQPKYQKNLDPLMPAIKHVPFNNYEALQKAVSPRTCAILLEPIQGEGGIYPADEEYMHKIRTLCDLENIVLIFDEVQCGIGRSGHFFAYQHYNLKPDIVAFAKGVAGGVPMGGIIANNKVSSAFTPGTHASTFGANPLATAASCYVLKKIGDPAFLKNVSEMGLYLRNGLEKLRSSCTQIVDIRGMGLMLGIEIKGDVGQIVNQAMNMGLLIVGAGNATIRLVPPLIVTKDEIDQAIFILKSCIH